MLFILFLDPNQRTKFSTKSVDILINHTISIEVHAFQATALGHRENRLNLLGDLLVPSTSAWLQIDKNAIFIHTRDIIFNTIFDPSTVLKFVDV